MWESPTYTFEKETIDKKGKIIKTPFYINVTYSAPRNLEDPGTALKGVFSKITAGRRPEDTHILDIGAAKLRNTLWLLAKGFHVWAVEFPELAARSEDAKKKWKRAEKYPRFHKMTFPNDFISLEKRFDFVLLINEINVMPIPIERFAMLALCREKIKDNGTLLWHQWRGLSTGQDKYSEDNAFIDGYLMGPGPNHSFYVEHDRETTHEMLYAVGFTFNEDLQLHKIPANSGYSFGFSPTHKSLIEDSLNINALKIQINDPKKLFPTYDSVSVLDLYIEELKHIPSGREHAHKFHLLASRIFLEVFRTQLASPKIEAEINEGRGRIDIVYKNKNHEGIFKNLKELRSIPCPEIFVECKNYANDLSNTEYSQLSDRLTPVRGLLGFLICRDKKDEKEVIKHCQDRFKHGQNKYIIVLDDSDLVKLARLKLDNENEDAINEFIEKMVKKIND